MDDPHSSAGSLSASLPAFSHGAAKKNENHVNSNLWFKWDDWVSRDLLKVMKFVTRIVFGKKK